MKKLKKWKQKQMVAEARRKNLPQDLPDRRVDLRPLTQKYNGDYHVMMQISLPREPWLPPNGDADA